MTIGIIGGTGMYELFEPVQVDTVETPYGETSAPLAWVDLPLPSGGSERVAFIPRHGSDHKVPPAAINYRANVWALAHVGVDTAIATCASGSLNIQYRRGDIVWVDQVLDFTNGREVTYFAGPTVEHATFADPYCRAVGAAAMTSTAIDLAPGSVHDTGTVVCIQGPRFASRAESRMYRAAGADIINMTQMPEAGLAREIGLHYAAMAIVTDYDAGVEGIEESEVVTQGAVYAYFKENLPAFYRYLCATVDGLRTTERSDCACKQSGISAASMEALRRGDLSS